MKSIYYLTFLLLNMYTVIATPKIIYPQSPKHNVVDTYFGTEVLEPYRWLENDRSYETLEWVTAQNKVTESYLSTIPYRDAIKKRIKELSNYPKFGVPFLKNGKTYFYKNDGLQNQNVLYVFENTNSQPRVVLDPNKLSADGTVALNQIEFSKNGKYLAYSIARSGSDWNEIYVLDLSTNTLLNDVVKWVKFSGIAWKGDGFFYSAYDAPVAGKEYSNKNEFHKIFFHKLGQNQTDDKLIFENKKHALRNCSASTSDDEKYLFITETESTTGNSLYFKELTDVESDIITLVSNFDNDYSVVDCINNSIYVLTNQNAPNQQLVAINPLQPEQANWKTIISESEIVLESIYIAGGKFIAKYNGNASNQVSIYDFSGKKSGEIKLPTIGTISSFSGSLNENDAYYSFVSFTYPPTIYKLDIALNTSILYQKAEVKFNPNDFVTEQQFFTSKDGTKVPMFITYKKGIKLNGKNPLMLYGYGGFNINVNPSFNTGRIPFIENGGIYVVANIRGGGEYGEKWHQAGTKLQKQNVFDDFIAAAEYLIAKGYTSKKKIAINGGSNGGLLIGACLTQRPDLFAVAVPEVGVLDMLRYQKFTIGWAWATDYGTSEESKEMFNYLIAYSPLHNVKMGVKYPATLIMTGDHDDRVVPAHSFKFAATLQAANKGNYVSLIRIDQKAGHGAGKPIAKVIDAQGDMWSFVMWNLGMKVINEK